MWCGINVSDPVGDLAVSKFDELFFAAEFDGVVDLSLDAFDGAGSSPNETV